MKTQHTYETHGKNKLIYRNGKPLLVMLPCPNPDDKDFKNVIVLQKVKTISVQDLIIDALMGD